jgi:hypothetical protein
LCVERADDVFNVALRAEEQAPLPCSFESVAVMSARFGGCPALLLVKIDCIYNMVLLYTVEILTRVGAISVAELPAHDHPYDRSASASETQQTRGSATKQQQRKGRAPSSHAAPVAHTHIIYAHEVRTLEKVSWDRPVLSMRMKIPRP